ncbi:helix-turn-helix domain-containing protein [Lysobacter cavernae]|uniref:Helix-turn-helix domain-containing protein n=1 Tax=Lysobacter cavernae TaxID=1685901 RepID=A0ABV7RKZ9_9GAMM
MMQSNEVAPDGGVSCGARLKQAREQAGLSHEDVSARLKMPVRVVRSLESGDLSQSGAPVFLRGQLRSYARLLGIDLEDLLSQTPVAAVAPSVLVSHTHTPRYRRVLEQATKRAVYIVMTAALAVPVWLVTRPHQNSNLAVQSLEVPATATAEPAAAQPPSPPAQRTPLIASIASLPASTTQQAALSLTLTGDSWVQVYAADGHTIEQGLLGAGQQRNYAAGEVTRMVLGNSAAVEVRQAGKPVDLAPFSRANVARFTLSSDGSLAPVAD